MNLLFSLLCLHRLTTSKFLWLATDCCQGSLIKRCMARGMHHYLKFQLDSPVATRARKTYRASYLVKLASSEPGVDRSNSVGVVKVKITTPPPAV